MFKVLTDNGQYINIDFQFLVDTYKRIFGYLYNDCKNLSEVFNRMCIDQELVCILVILEDFINERYGQQGSLVVETFLEIHEIFVGQLEEYTCLTEEDFEIDPGLPQRRIMELIESIKTMQREYFDINYKSRKL